MGLLDDAIREHLELKRLRGADPGDVAREEQDALGPEGSEQGVERSNEIEGDGRQALQDADGQSSESRHPLGSSNEGQETIEINMEAELSSGEDRGASSPKGAAPVGHPAHAPDADEDSLEWEVPGEELTDTPEDSDHHNEGEPHVEDVLEETPDFLRDTPEQERLWFEQRPPRDFDFNE
jgi:hypothetical protein